MEVPSHPCMKHAHRVPHSPPLVEHPLTRVADKHDVVLVGHERVEEVGQACGLDRVDKHAVEVPRDVGELGHLVLPGCHAALGLVHKVVKHGALLGELHSRRRGEGLR